MNRRILSVALGLAFCGLIGWEQSLIAKFSPSSGLTARGLVKAYYKAAYDEGRGKDAAAAYFAPDMVDHAAGAIDRENGPPIPHRIEKIIADGMTVAVYHRIDAARGAPAMDVVDIYEADRFSRVHERWRIVQPLAPAGAAATT